MTLTELAERCEQATGPDRELDEQCALAIGFTLVVPRPDERLQGIRRWVGPEGERNGWVHNRDSLDFPPAYTASLDAAMMLVPEGWHIEEMHEGCGAAPKRVGLMCWEFINRGKGSTLALALCAAALKALSETHHD